MMPAGWPLLVGDKKDNKTAPAAFVASISSRKAIVCDQYVYVSQCHHVCRISPALR